MTNLEEQLAHMASTDYPVFLWRWGNSNTEDLARFVHRKSRFAKHPFITVSCPTDLRESWIRAMAHVNSLEFPETAEIPKQAEPWMPGGTLYVDEIVGLPSELQRGLLALLDQEGLIRFIAANGQGIEIRIISASTMKLWKTTGNERVRSDLFFRLNVLSAHVRS